MPSEQSRICLQIRRRSQFTNPTGSLGLHLKLVRTKLRTSEGRYYPAPVEAEITGFLEGCEIEFYPTASADEAEDLEVEFRDRLKPELNISRARRRRRVT